jgi:hypothetical protein
MSDNPLQEHAEAAEEAREGNKRAALLVAVLAATLALAEQGAKHAEMRVEDSSIGATDTWAQYQAKSTRTAMARDFADLLGALPSPADPQAASRVTALQTRLRSDLNRYDTGPASRQASAERAHDLEQERDDALRHAHGFDNAAAALELGIVMVTASVVVRVAALLWVGALLGASGLVFAVLAMVAPGLASF